MVEFWSDALKFLFLCGFGRHDFFGSRRVAWCRRRWCHAKELRPL